MTKTKLTLIIVEDIIVDNDLKLRWLLDVNFYFKISTSV